MDVLLISYITPAVTVVGALIVYFRGVGKADTMVESLVVAANNLTHAFESFKEVTVDRLSKHDVELGKHDTRLTYLERKS